MQKKIPEPLVAVFFGLTGSGKSYLAVRWAARHGLEYLNSDQIRKELGGVAPESRHHVAFNQGLYSPEMTRRTYDAMVDLATRCCSRPGASGVVLDGSYGKRGQRDQVVERFAGASRIIFIYCYCAESVTRHRFTLRAEDDRAVSDGRWEIYVGQKRIFEVPEEVDGAHFAAIDTDKPVAALIEEVDQAIQSNWPDTGR